VKRFAAIVCFPWLAGTLAVPVLAAADPIGVTAFRSVDATLTGSGIRISQVEASGPGWQANPAALGRVDAPFRWTSAQGTATNFPNALGSESGHANEVARLFASVAPGAFQIDNYESGYFTSQIIPGELPIRSKVVNQSFAYFTRSASVDQEYDDYAARYDVLFVSGAGNSGRPKSPGTAYNGICVGAYGGVSSIGPASDGRCKPDLVAPAGYTSFAAPLVSGAAALLAEAGAADIRVLKALLLNGARKPEGWTNSASSPLDPRYGAGILNIYNSYRQFRGCTNLIRRGWDLGAVSGSTKEYMFPVTGRSNQTFELTVTLVWLRSYGEININNLDLSVHRDDLLVAASRSAIDNVEHIYLRGLAPGTYRLKISTAANVSEDETYALAYEFRSEQGPRFVNPTGEFSATLIGEPLHGYQIQGSTDLATWSRAYEGFASADGILDFRSVGNSFPFFRALELP
jgi:hypothetical protein